MAQLSRVQSQAGASRGLIPLKTGTTTENLYFLLFIVCHPIIEITLKIFIFISFYFAHYLCCLPIQKALLICLSSPLKKGVANPFIKTQTKKGLCESRGDLITQLPARLFLIPTTNFIIYFRFVQYFRVISATAINISKSDRSPKRRCRSHVFTQTRGIQEKSIR